MNFWMNFGEGVLGSALSVGLVTGFMSYRYSRKLSRINSKYEHLLFVSSALYKQREKAILDFDLAWRGFVGSCSHLIDGNMREQSEFDSRHDLLAKYYSDLQVAFFRGSLVFEEELLQSSRALIDICHDLNYKSSMAITMLAGGRGFSLDGVKPDPDFAWDANEYLPIRDEIRVLIGTVGGQILKDWESNARDALKQIK